MASTINSSALIGGMPAFERISMSSFRWAPIALARRRVQGDSESPSIPSVSETRKKRGADEGILDPWGVEQRAFGLRVKRGRPLSPRAGLKVAAVADSVSLTTNHRVSPARLRASGEIALSLKNWRP